MFSKFFSPFESTVVLLLDLIHLAVSQVGLLEIGGKHEQPARILTPALTHGVYSISWGEGMQLYASGGNKLVVYRADAPTEGNLYSDIVIKLKVTYMHLLLLLVNG